MILKVRLDNQLLELNVPESFIHKAEDFFARMDHDMDRGWQVNRDWVEDPDRELRALIAADKLLTALENDDHRLGRLMAAYIVSRMPDVSLVELNAMGETRDHVIHTVSGDRMDGAQARFAHDHLPCGLNKMQAMAQAGKDVSKVFKIGRQYRFTVFNHGSGKWDESPAFGRQEDAEAVRDKAFKQRFDALCSH